MPDIAIAYEFWVNAVFNPYLPGVCNFTHNKSNTSTVFSSAGTESTMSSRGSPQRTVSGHCTLYTRNKFWTKAQESEIELGEWGFEMIPE